MQGDVAGATGQVHLELSITYSSKVQKMSLRIRRVFLPPEELYSEFSRKFSDICLFKDVRRNSGPRGALIYSGLQLPPAKWVLSSSRDQKCPSVNSVFLVMVMMEG